MHDRVGAKNVSIRVAKQQVFVSAIENPAFSAVCTEGWYGQVGELCVQCPEGSHCPGGFAEPSALLGFWKLNLPVVLNLRTGEFNELCDKKRRAREHCPFIIPCDPPDSCLGENKCSERYSGVRCALCRSGFYRVAGECEKCPSNPMLMAMTFVAVAFGVAVLANRLQNNRTHMGLLDIGINYFQVLAMFMRAKVEWPAEIRWIFKVLSFFNLNIELLAPECSFASFSFWRRWRWSMATPLIIVPGAALMQYNSKWKQPQSERMSATVGTIVTVLYFVYLPVVRMTFEMMNCSPTDPPDGHEYLSAVFEKCYDQASCTDAQGNPKECHFEHTKYADWALIGYVIGIPGSFAYLLKTYHGKDAQSSDSGSVDHMRAAFKKLYYLFDQAHYYWILVLMARKVTVAFASLMFRRAPTFQLAFSLLVLFGAYVLQVKHRPYLSSEHALAISAATKSKEFKGLSERQRKVAVDDLRQQIKSGRASKVSERKQKAGLAGKRRRTSMAVIRSAAVGATAAAKEFFWDCNTVEMTLLGCSVLVCLAGIMFGSSRLKDSSYYDADRAMVTYSVLAVILYSLTYWNVVFLSEIFQWKSDRLKRLQAIFGERRRHQRVTQNMRRKTSILHAVGKMRARSKRKRKRPRGQEPKDRGERSQGADGARVAPGSAIDIIEEMSDLEEEEEDQTST